jgi:hypothetical protein
MELTRESTTAAVPVAADKLTWIFKRKSRPDRHRKRWPRLRVIDGQFVVLSEQPATP